MDLPARRWALLAAAVAVLAAGVAVVVWAGDGDGGPVARPTTTTTTAASTTTAPTTTAPADDGQPHTTMPAELAAAVDELSRFVEDQRGLEFIRPVTVELLDGEEFERRLLDDLQDDREDLARDERLLKALDLLDDDVDLFEALVSVLGAGVVGFYDPETEELVVRGGGLTVYGRTTLVHELVHALDDQHFELHRPEVDDADDERGIGFAALVEGNAVRVQRAWEDTLGSDDRRQLQREQAEAASRFNPGRFPRFIVAVIAFPYLFGPDLVARVVDRGGEGAVNQAFSDPPSTTEQVLRPEAYVGGEGAREVRPPAAEGEVIDEGAIGQWVLYLMLSERMSQANATAAAEGWGGDWYVAWERGADVCVRSAFVMDDRRELDELVEALQEWSAAHDDARLDVSGEVATLTACG